MIKRCSAIAALLLSLVTVIVVMFSITAGAIPVATASGAPRMPKGAKNYVTDSMEPTIVAGVSTWEKGVWTPDYKKTLAEEIPTISFDLDGLTAQDEYVMSFWARYYDGVTDWNAAVSLQYSTEGDKFQKIAVLPNLTQYFRFFPNETGGGVGEAERMIGTITGKGAPVDKDFKVDIHVTPSGTGTVNIALYINNERQKCTWGSGESIIGMDAYTPSFILSGSAVKEVWGIRVYKVDADATDFEPDATKPSVATTTTTTTTTVTPATNATQATVAGGNATTPNATSATNGTNASGMSGGVENAGSMRWIILAVVVVVILAGGGAVAFFVIKKVK